MSQTLSTADGSTAVNDTLLQKLADHLCERGSRGIVDNVGRTWNDKEARSRQVLHHLLDPPLWRNGILLPAHHQHRNVYGGELCSYGIRHCILQRGHRTSSARHQAIPGEQWQIRPWLAKHVKHPAADLLPEATSMRINRRANEHG